MKPYYQDNFSRIFLGSCLDILPLIKDNTFDSVVTDPPYEISLLAHSWDSSGIAYNVDLWKQVFRTMKPGAHLAAFGSPRMFHRMMVAIEDAGFEIRDMMPWIHGQGMPKGQDVSKAFDKANGAKREMKTYRPRPESSGSFVASTERRPWDEVARAQGFYQAAGGTPVSEEAIQWDGWNTVLNPAYEPIVLARKPMIGRMVDNVREYGVGPINVDATRIPHPEGKRVRANKASMPLSKEELAAKIESTARWTPSTNDLAENPLGQYPKNIIFDEEAIQELDRQMRLNDPLLKTQAYRFYITPKPKVRERDSGLQYNAETGGRLNRHLTVKPLELMRYLVRLLTPKGGLVLDPFLGSGTTRLACNAEYMRCVGIELEEASAKTAAGRG